MKKTGIISMFLLILTALTSTHVCAEEMRRGPKGPPPFPDSVQALFDKTTMDTMAISVLATLTGQTEDTLWDTMGDGHIFDLMKEFAVDRDSFREAMDVLIIEKINAAAETGTVSQADAAEAIEMIENRPEKPERGGRGERPEGGRPSE